MRAWHSIQRTALLGALCTACAEPDCPVGTVQVGNICRRTDAGPSERDESTERNLAGAPNIDSGAAPASTPQPVSTETGRGVASPTTDAVLRPDAAVPPPATEGGVASTKPLEPATSDGGQSGVCTPGTLKCDDRTPSECLTTGQWTEKPQCPLHAKRVNASAPAYRRADDAMLRAEAFKCVVQQAPGTARLNSARTSA